MFRALLWKEWRELWPLPVAAGLLSGISFLAVANVEDFRLTLSVWEMSFSVWLFLAALYLPTHMYVRERETNTSRFLLSKSLDRFRLWWINLIICLTVFIAIGVILYGVTVALSGLYESNYRQEGVPDTHRANLVVASVWISFLLFCFSSSASTIFRRQLTAIVSTIAVFPLFWIVSDLGKYSSFPVYWFSKDPKSSYALLLILCPLFLLISLVAFARGDLWRRTRRHIISGYTLSATMALIPVIIGTFYLFPLIEEAFKPLPDWIRVMGISRDGTRVLLNKDPGFMLLSLDIAGKQVNMIDKDVFWYRVHMRAQADAIVYEKEPKIIGSFYCPPSTLILSDFDGSNRQKLFSGSFLNRRRTSARWSIDGNYLGLTSWRWNESEPETFVAICDSKGTILNKHIFPALEGEFDIDPLLWDFKNRFYFRKVNWDDEHSPRTWRIRLDNFVPESVSLIPVVSYPGSQRYISSNGKWIVYEVDLVYSDNCELWLYNAASDTNHRISPRARDFSWSNDGSRLAYLEAGENSTSRLMLYEPGNGNTSQALLEGLSEKTWVGSWSLSDGYLLLKSEEPDSVYLLSLETGKIIQVSEPGEKWHYVHWIENDRLMWAVRNKLITTDLDGSNPEEIFRVEGGKMYLYGEEQS